MEARTRIVVVAVLAAVVFGMGVHHASVSEERWPYPSSDDIEASYDDHVGEEVFLFGTVEAVDEDAGTARIRVDADGGSFDLTVRPFDADVQPGGVVQVVGTLQEGHTLDAGTVRVVNPAGSSDLFKYAVSTVGALLVVVAFFRHWQLDVSNLAFRGR